MLRLCVFVPSPVVLLLASGAFAQWTDDASANTPIFTGAGEQVQPKIVPLSSGGSYVSWFGNSGTGYDVFLQRLDENGVPQWDAATTLIQTRPFSSTQDYGLSIDADDRALLIFRDERESVIQIVAHAVTPDGTRSWGATGLQLSNDGTFKASPRIVGLPGGGSVAAYISNSETIVSVLDADGQIVSGPFVLSDAGANAFLSDLVPGGSTGPAADGAWILWVRQQGPVGARQLRVTPLNTVTETLGDPIVLFESGSLQFGNFPAAFSDGAGGLVTAWYTSSPALQCFAQRIDANGTVLWLSGGVPLSTNAVRSRTDPSIAMREVDGGFTLFWTETNAAQSQFGVYGQRLSGSGNREWADEGIEVVPLGSSAQTQVRSVPTAEGNMVLWAEGLSFNDQRLRAFSLDDNGLPNWPSIVTVSDVASSISRQQAVAVEGRTAVVTVWSDGRNDSGDIYAQRLSQDGVLGGGSSGNPGDLNGDGVVDLSDLLLLLAAWGPCPKPCSQCDADLNGDCFVDLADLLLLLANWG